VLYRVLGGVAASILVIWAVSLLFKSDEERIADSIDAAREALHAGRDDEFLAWFTADVDYRDGGGTKGLRSDLARWRSRGRLRAFIGEPRIVVGEGTATVELDVGVGLSPIQTFPAHVDLGLREEDQGWRVFRVAWASGKRPKPPR